MLFTASGSLTFMNKIFLFISCVIIVFGATIHTSFAGVNATITATFVIKNTEYPQSVKNLEPVEVYLTYSGPSNFKPFKNFLKQDTIVNLKGFIDSASHASIGYRLVFKSNNGSIDSLYDLNNKFQIQLKGYAVGNNLLKVIAYDSLMQVNDNFVFNYGEKFKNKENYTLTTLVRSYKIYNSYDRSNYVVQSVWMLSIGIDDYGKIQFEDCASDALSYLDFFKKEYQNFLFSDSHDLFHGYLLLDRNATKDSILKVLKEIISKASSNDYFIFAFNGESNLFTLDSLNYSTYFFPYNVVGYIDSPANRNTRDTADVVKNLLSLKTLEEYIQLIPATNQLFISEAGPSKKFKTEFIKTVMQNSPTVSGILNKNRVIIVPNRAGYDDLFCQGKRTNKGPINYYITSLDSAYNIYDIFKDNYQADQISFLLKEKSVTCKSFDFEYFDVFFEKRFLQQYKEIFGDEENRTRGVTVDNKKLNEVAGLTGKRYALVVGTDNYSGAGWQKLNNPVYDATSVADELKQDYGFEVNLLKDPSMDTVYNSIRDYYQKLQTNDELIIYFAGHGDFDEDLLDDGFIVCADSKAIVQDPIRNTYIQYSKIKRMINKIPAKEILVILDICHGGTFDEDILGAKGRENTGSANVNMNVMQFLKEKSQYKTRRFLSSVGNESAFDGRAGRHSPFANLLLQVLRTKGSGTNGILTLSNVYSVLETASYNETTSLKISPHAARFGDDDALGEFVLIPVSETGNNEK